MRSRILFERLVKQFPSSARYWRSYIEQEVFGPAFFPWQQRGSSERNMGVVVLYFVGVVVSCFMSSICNNYVSEFIIMCHKTSQEWVI